ncbi:hypothetical protein VKT23_010646 [Stygiomarasmius scandens]|uniref:3-beta hydroxysteroid dehydrogenase/isomerase domain-containing protein n=1 Tax=Marasmiellus scandens TaxID=2682957 RepID=A0ABR1JDJ2_9AGAR
MSHQNSTATVFVTGGTGFLGSHVIHQLLQPQGADAKPRYHVRASARDVAKLERIFPQQVSDKSLEVVQIPDLVKSDHRPYLKGVDALIHCASSIPGDPSISVKDLFEASYKGAVNVVEQAIEVGVKKIVVTGTAGSLFPVDMKEAFDPNTKIDETAYNPINSADELDPKLFDEPTDAADAFQKQMYVYMIGKALSDKKIWEIANRKENEEVDVSMILPPDIFGEYVPNYPYPKSLAARSSLGTNDHVYYLLTGGPHGPNTYPPIQIGHEVDVKDAAKAHIRALDAPPVYVDKKRRNKRFIVCGSQFTWKEAAEIIRRARPELASRLPIDGEGEGHVSPAQTCMKFDASFTKDVLGMDKYVPFEETLLGAVDVCLEFERRVNGS